MKRYKMDKWGQIPIFPKPEEGQGIWTVRSTFLTMIGVVIAIVFIYSIISNLM
jgi:hypothetical protein